ncbi:MAG: transglutaminase N-terminal domain-containing protein [Acidimicrobiales bacterium]
MIFEITHVTRYDYDEPVVVSHGDVRQLPGDRDGQRCLRRSVRIDPGADHVRERRDWFGNDALVYAVREPHTRLEVISRSVVDTTDRPTEIGAGGEQPWETHTIAALASPSVALVEAALDSPLVARSEQLAAYAAQSFTPARPLAEALSECCTRIHDDFAFDPEATDVETPLVEVMRIRRGVCQDFAHVLLGCLRSVGLAGRYVSGYLETRPPPGRPRLTGVDRTHAWVAVGLADGRWIGIDPTNDQMAGSAYVTTAHGRDYADVPPLKGVVYTEATESVLTVTVDVVPTGAATAEDPALP